MSRVVRLETGLAAGAVHGGGLLQAEVGLQGEAWGETEAQVNSSTFCGCAPSGGYNGVLFLHEEVIFSGEKIKMIIFEYIGYLGQF